MPKTSLDQLGNQLSVSSFPSRIISLVPSQTELMADLSLDKEVVGITKFCIYPAEWKKSKTLVGGTKNVDVNVVRKLKPDLIIANKEENERAQIELLQKEFPVWVSDVLCLPDALSMIKGVGGITNRVSEATTVVSQIENAFLRLKSVDDLFLCSVLYLIWRKPWMAVAADTFISDMLNRIGFKNCIGDLMRYPVLTDEDIHNLKPDLVMLSSEPYPFKQKHMDEIRSLCPQSKIILVDGEMFSWYGSRLLRAPAYFNAIQQSL